MKLNSVKIIGRLVRDAETRMTQTGKIKQSFSIAYNDDYKKQGTEEWIKRVYYFNCYAWKEYEYMFKGARVLIIGKLVMLTYEDKKTGEKKSLPYIEVISLDFMADNTNKPTQQQQQCTEQVNKQAESQEQQEYPIKEEDISEEVPF